MIERIIYKELLEWKNNNIKEPIMLIGARQTGKTFILEEFCKKEYDDYLYVNFDQNDIYEKFFEKSLNSEEIIKKMEIYFEREINVEKTIIFFDEIQKSERAISSLKYFCESKKNYRIVCAGSLLGVKINRFKSSFPVGKVKFKYMFPIDFSEFLVATGNIKLKELIEESYFNNKKMEDIFHEKSLNIFSDYLYVGGMPAAVKNYIENDKNIAKFDNEINSNIINAYIADMAKYTKGTEAIKTTKIYNSMPEQLGKENKKFTYKLVDNTAKKSNYGSSIDWLIQSNLLLICKKIKLPEAPLRAYEINNNFKLYLSDVGLLSSLCKLNPSDYFNNNINTFKGVISENFVAGTFIANGLDLNYWESNSMSEVDFILNIDGDIIPIEVKSGENTQSKSLIYYMKKYNPKYAIRISGKNFGFNNNIKSIPLYAAYLVGSKVKE